MSPPNHESPAAPGWLPEEPLACLLAELRRRWESGDRVSVEAFLAERSAGAVSDDELLDLVYLEVVLREGRGVGAEPEEYARRFPFLADQLRKQFEVDRAPVRLRPATCGK